MWGSIHNILGKNLMRKRCDYLRKDDFKTSNIVRKLGEVQWTAGAVLLTTLGNKAVSFFQRSTDAEICCYSINFAKP